MSSRCEQLALQHAIAQAEFELAYQDAAIAEFPQGTRVRWMIVGHPQFAWASGTVMRTGGMLALVRSDDGNLHEPEYSWLQLVAKAPAGAPARAWYLPPAGLRHDAQRKGEAMTTARTETPEASQAAPAVGIRLDRPVGRLEPEHTNADAPVCPWCDRQGWGTCQHYDDTRACTQVWSAR